VVTISFTLGTQTEALSSASANSTAFTASGAAAAVLLPTGAAFLPANFWPPSYSGVGKSLLIKAHGVLSTTTGTNALTFGITANSGQATYNAAGIIATTGAVNQTASLTNVPWELEVIAVASATGGSGTILADGIMKVYPTTSTLLAMRCSSSAANPNTALSLDTRNAFYVEMFANWGAASNSISAYSFIVLGLN
jgi:hypothetical protein